MKVIICKYIFRLGDINAFGADPRRVAKAGHDVDNAEPIDFAEKYSKQNTSLSARYDSLKVKTKPKENNDYVNGKSFCCNGKNLDEIEKNNTQTAENAKLEDNLYFYHPDHLGSTNLITNFDGEVTQSVAYVPYGEVFVEERNGSWASPFLFNAKELDEETGLYYYGARYLNPTDCRWLAVDPVFHPGASPYAYCLGNPVKLVDPTGTVECENGNVVIEYDVNLVKNVMNKRKQEYKEIEEYDHSRDLYDGNYKIENEKLVDGSGKYNIGVAYTDKKGDERGEPFLVLTAVNPDVEDDLKSNCSGLAFLGGQAAVFSPFESEIILREEYQEFDPNKTLGPLQAGLPIVAGCQEPGKTYKDHFSRLNNLSYENGLFSAGFTRKMSFDKATISFSEGYDFNCVFGSSYVNAGFDMFNNHNTKFYYKTSGTNIRNRTNIPNVIYESCR